MHYSSCITVFKVKGLDAQTQAEFSRDFNQIATELAKDNNVVTKAHIYEVTPALWLPTTGRLACAFRASAQEGSPVPATRKFIDIFSMVYEGKTSRAMKWEPFMILDGYGMGLDLFGEKKPQYAIYTHECHH